MRSGIEIVNLADRPELIEKVAEMLWLEWGKKHGRTLDEVIYRTRHSAHKGRVPQVRAAVRGPELVGTFSIWNNDLMSRQDLTPWLTCLCVKEEYRNAGIGTMLQNECLKIAKELGFDRIYLITDHENYYEKTGWRFLETVQNKVEETRLYEHSL